MNKILGTSFILSLIRKFYEWLYRLRQMLAGLYQESQIHRLISSFCSIIRKDFRFSFIGRITEIRDADNLIAFDNSRVINYLKNFYVKFQDKIIFSFTRSRLLDLTKEIRQELYLLPIKIVSLIILIAIMSNAILSIILVKEISLWVWFLRGLLFFSSIIGLFCSLGWQDISQASLFLRCLKKLKG